MSTSPAVKIPHLVLGLILLGVSAGWLLFALDVLEPQHLPYAAPVVLVLAGMLGLLVMVLGARRTPAAPVDETGDEHTAPLSTTPYRTEDDR